MTLTTEYLYNEGNKQATKTSKVRMIDYLRYILIVDFQEKTLM